MELSLRQRATWLAHLFKAVAYQYHRPLGQRLRRLLPPDSIIIDVGAHSGQHVKLFAAMIPEGTVFAFEPGSYAYSILRRVADWRRIKNVVLINEGLSDKTMIETLYMPLKRRGSIGFGLSHVGAGNDGRKTIAEEIRLTTLDLFVAHQGLNRIDFIKVDIEGWEAHFLRGAAASIARLRPSLLLEVNKKALARAASRADEIFEMLQPLGYTIFKTFEDDDYAMLPVAGFDGGADYLFVPSEKAHLLGNGQEGQRTASAVV